MCDLVNEKKNEKIKKKQQTNEIHPNEIHQFNKKNKIIYFEF